MLASCWWLWRASPDAKLRRPHPGFSAALCALQAIITALGVDRRNRVLAGLYMGRSDTQLVVRQASLHVWKIVVSNTPRTLREILPTLFGLLLGFLASTCADKRTVSLPGLAGSQPYGHPQSWICSAVGDTGIPYGMGTLNWLFSHPANTHCVPHRGFLSWTRGKGEEPPSLSLLRRI